MQPENDDIPARLARYAVTRDARDLWPEVSASAFQAAQREMVRVTAAVLAGAPSPVRLDLPRDADTRALGVAASAAGMGPLLGFWCATGRVDAQQSVLDLLAGHLDHGRQRAARLRQELERILVPFADRGIEVLVLKGADTAYRYFPEPGTRPSSDLDLLVAPHDVAAARSVLVNLGFAEQGPGHGDRYRTTWTPPAVGGVRSLELAHPDNPWSVDLHVSLDREMFPGRPMTFGTLPPTPGPRDGEVWQEFSRPVWVLREPLLLAYLAAHTSSHFYAITLVRLVELVLVARRDFGEADWRAFADLVRRTATGRFVFPALYLAEQLAPGTMDAPTLKDLEAVAPRWLRKQVRATTPASAQRLHPYPFRERFLWATTLTELLLELAWPHEQNGGRVENRRVSPRQILGVYWQRIRKRFLRFVRTRVP